MKPYYYIFRVGDSHPGIKHRTLESAHTEAMRLATQHPGDSFEILQCLSMTRTVNPQTFWMDGVIPPHECDDWRKLSATQVCAENPSVAECVAGLESRLAASNKVYFVPLP